MTYEEALERVKTLRHFEGYEDSETAARLAAEEILRYPRGFFMGGEGQWIYGRTPVNAEGDEEDIFGLGSVEGAYSTSDFWNDEPGNYIRPGEDV